MRRVGRFLPVLIIPLMGGCASSDCFEWSCELDARDLPKYQTFLQAQDLTKLTFGEKEYRYQLIQWIGEKQFAAAKQGNQKSDYDQFLKSYAALEAEAGQTFSVYAEIAKARSSGDTTVAEEPKPIFSKDDFIPKIPPLQLEVTDAQITIAANPIITEFRQPEPVEPEALPTPNAPIDSLLNRSISHFSDNNSDSDPSQKELKRLIDEAAAQGDYATAFEGLMNFANRDDTHAQYLIGRMYQDGIGVDQNYQTAIDWFEKSSNQNGNDAKGALLEMYEVGLGVPQTARGLVTWHLRAAKLGNPSAQTQVGIFYENGEGVTKNLNEAAKWYRRAALQGNPNAQFLLGWMYAEGQGVELDFIEAYSWFYVANTRGLADASRLMKLVLEELTAEEIKSAQQRADQRAAKLRG